MYNIYHICVETKEKLYCESTDLIKKMEENMYSVRSANSEDCEAIMSLVMVRQQNDSLR